MCKRDRVPDRDSRCLPAEAHEPHCDHSTDRPAALAIIGGDARQISVSASLVQAGFEVRMMGFGEAEDGGLSPSSPGSLPQGVKICHRLDRALEECLGIILPYPATKDGQTVYCPLDTGHTLTLSEIGHYIEKRPSVQVFGGRMPEAWVSQLRQKGCHVTDYEESEAFLIKNARLTAEGAVMIAMELTDTALLHASVAVLGYGRIGRLLCRLLSAMGADVAVFARRQESLAEAEAEGYRAVSTANMPRLCEGYQVIFNTIPVRLINREILLSLPCDTKIIELASSPGGLDPAGVTEATRRCGLQVIHAPSLPGRYAPVDAGYAIAEHILEILGEVTV